MVEPFTSELVVVPAYRPFILVRPYPGPYGLYFFLLIEFERRLTCDDFYKHIRILTWTKSCKTKPECLEAHVGLTLNNSFTINGALMDATLPVVIRSTCV